MAKFRTKDRHRELNELLSYNHSLNGGILVGLEGHVVEVQGRAIQVLRKARPWRNATSISGLSTPDAAREVLQRITGAFAKLAIPDPEVEILVNLAPANLFKGGAWKSPRVGLI